MDQAVKEGPKSKPRLSLRRRLVFALIIYAGFVLVLATIEVGTRMLFPAVSGLDLFVVTPQQQAQFTDREKVSIFESDPLLLWRLKPNLNNAIWDFTVVSTNSQHLRADHAIGRKQHGTIRILCLGDSVTFGYRVPAVWPEHPNDYDRDALRYPELIERALGTANAGRSIEVITMAVPGYTSHQGLAWLRRDIDWFAPDLITVSFGWNDASLSDFPDRETIRTDWHQVAYRWLVDHSQAFAHLTGKWRSSERPATARTIKPTSRVAEKEYIQNMMAIGELAQTRNIPLIMIGAIYRDSVTNPPEAQLMTSYREALKRQAQEKGIRFLEVLELTEAAHPSNQGWFGELIHPNHLGHRLLASELLKVLSTEELLRDLNIPALTP